MFGQVMHTNYPKLCNWLSPGEENVILRNPDQRANEEEDHSNVRHRWG